jgi:hypothetical protein
MPISNYGELKIAVADLIDRHDIEPTIVADWIKMAESKMNRLLKHNRVYCRGATIGWRSNLLIPLPEDWLEGHNIEVIVAKDNPEDPTSPLDGERYQLVYQSSDLIDMMRQGRTPTIPSYTFFDGVIEIYPDPKAEFRVQMDYYKKVPALITDLQTNWMLTEHPDLYLYGAAVHSAPFLRDDMRIPMWDKMATEGIFQLNERNDRSRTSGSRLARRVAYSLG